MGFRLYGRCNLNVSCHWRYFIICETHVQVTLRWSVRDIYTCVKYGHAWTHVDRAWILCSHTHRVYLPTPSGVHQARAFVLFPKRVFSPLAPKPFPQRGQTSRKLPQKPPIRMIPMHICISASPLNTWSQTSHFHIYCNKITICSFKINASPNYFRSRSSSICCIDLEPSWHANCLELLSELRIWSIVRIRPSIQMIPTRCYSTDVAGRNLNKKPRLWKRWHYKKNQKPSKKQRNPGYPDFVGFLIIYFQTNSDFPRSRPPAGQHSRKGNSFISKKITIFQGRGRPQGNIVEKEIRLFPKK